MTRIVCQEFDEFVETLPRLKGQYILRTSQTREWRLRTVELNGLTLTTGREGAGRVYNGVGQDGHFHLFLLLSGCQFATLNGARFDRSHVAWLAPGTMFHSVTDEPITWLNITVPADLVLRWAQTHMDEFDHSLLRRSSLHIKGCRSVTPLIRLAQRLLQVDARSPEVLQTTVAKGAAQANVLDCLFRTLPPVGSCGPTPRRCEHHAQVLRSALDMLETLDTDALRAEDLCAAADASERTVRSVFHEYLGMSPHRYLMTRRLHAIRSAIRQAGPEDTVTSICSRFGVWDFGRFAKQYKTHFGVLPSQSLHARRGDRAQQERRRSVALYDSARQCRARVFAE